MDEKLRNRISESVKKTFKIKKEKGEKIGYPKGRKNPKISAYRQQPEVKQKYSDMLIINNPSKRNDIRKKISNTLKEKYKKASLKVWNKGLTKETDERVRKNAEKSRQTLRKLYKEGFLKAWNKGYGDYIKGEKHPRFGKIDNNSGNCFRTCFKRDDINHITRSKWEANFARILKYEKIEYDYEPRAFKIVIKRGLTTYRPDFFIKQDNIYIEIKGWFTKESKEKINAFMEQYPSIILFLIKEKEYDVLKHHYQNKIKNWEN